VTPHPIDRPDEPVDPPAAGATITPRTDGPLVVRGDFAIVGGDGKVIHPGRRTVALCRCGRSSLKPFCDGSHRSSTFRASDGDERAPRE
jgi:CDGSH-type Zn-finger protein